MTDFSALSWPGSRLGDALTMLARHTGFDNNTAGVRSPENDSALEGWIEWGAKKLGCEAHLLACGSEGTDRRRGVPQGCGRAR